MSLSLDQVLIGKVNETGFQTQPGSIKAHELLLVFVIVSSLTSKKQTLHFGRVKFLVYI